MTWLLDGNSLVALAIETHLFHARTRTWFDAQSEPFATCAVTEGTLLRLHMRSADDRSAAAAWAALAALRAMPNHEFWDDGFSYQEVGFAGLKGHPSVTDAWLAELARRKNGKVATLDVEFAAHHPDVAVLLPP